MPSLPHLSGAEVVRILERLDFVVARQRGSHIMLRGGAAGCVVPNHREVKLGTLAGLLKQAACRQKSSSMLPVRKLYDVFKATADEVIRLNLALPAAVP